MAVDIGPRIGLEGEAEYKKSLKEIIAEQKALAAEMKATESAFDKNASAQDKAKAKMENLNKQIENQKKYVETLKEQLEKAKEAYGDNSEKVSKLRENLAKAETALNKMESEQKDLNDTIKKAPFDDMKKKLDEVSKKVEKVGEGMKKVGESMTKCVTAPIVAGAGLSVAAWKEVDEAMDEIVKMTGKTGDELEELQDIAKDISTTLPVAFEDAAKAVGEVNTRFDASGELADELSQKFLKFAQITDSDVVTAIDGTQHAMAAWGLSTEKTSDLLDVFAKVAQDTGTSVDTLMNGVADNKLVFDEMGMSIYTAAGFLGELDKNGVDSSATMAGLKKALQNATKQGKPLDQALKELSDTLISGESDTEAYQEAMDLFGAKAGPQLAEALRTGKISLTDFARTLADAGGTVETTFDAMLDPADKFTTTLNELKLLGSEVGGTLLEALAPVLVKIGNAIADVAEWWASLSPHMQETLLVVGGIVAAVGPLLSFLGTIVTIVSGMIPILGTLGVTIGGVMAAAAPVVAVVLSIIAVIMIVVEVVKHWGEITEWFGNTWNKITNWVKGDATSVSDWINKKWTAVCDWTEQAWSDVKDWTSEAWENVKTTVKDAATAAGSWVSEKWDALKQKTSEAWASIKQKVSENGGGIRGVLATATEAYKSLWSNAFTAIDNLTGGKLGEALSKVRDKLASIKQSFTDTFNNVRDFIRNTLDKIKNFFSNLKLTLPHIKLPHFKLTGKFSLSPPSVPKLSIDWYKKAYSQPMMFTSPTVLSTASGLKGFGDGSGGEIVIGQNMMYRMIESAVRGAGGRENNYQIEITVNGAAGQSVDDLAEAISERLTFEIQRREAALA